MPTGVGVSIEVTGHGDARTLDAVSLPLRPVSDATARLFDCPGRGVWRLKLMLEVRSRRSRPICFSPPRRDLPSRTSSAIAARASPRREATAASAYPSRD